MKSPAVLLPLFCLLLISCGDGGTPSTKEIPGGVALEFDEFQSEKYEEAIKTYQANWDHLAGKTLFSKEPIRLDEKATVHVGMQFNKNGIVYFRASPISMGNWSPEWIIAGTWGPELGRPGKGEPITFQILVILTTLFGEDDGDADKFDDSLRKTIFNSPDRRRIKLSLTGFLGGEKDAVHCTSGTGAFTFKLYEDAKDPFR